MCLTDYLSDLLELLMNHADHAEELIRSTVSESMGRLFIVFSTDMIQYIDDGLKAASPMTKTTIANCVKYFGSKADFEEPLMLSTVAEDLVCLKDEADPELKKCAFEGLTAIVHGNFSAVRELVGDIENFAHQETVVRPELIEEIDLGSFKIKKDNGLTMRKAAFRLLETLY